MSSLKLDLFTTAAVDNIDHNPSSATAQDSFHGTGISIFQHPTLNNQGINQLRHTRKEAIPNNKLSNLPAIYTEVTPILSYKSEPEHRDYSSIHKEFLDTQVQLKVEER